MFDVVCELLVDVGYEIEQDGFDEFGFGDGDVIDVVDVLIVIELFVFFDFDGIGVCVVCSC